MPEYIVGLDIGTSSTKAVALTLNGKILGKKTAAYPTFSPRTGWQEQDPEMVITGALRCLLQVIMATEGNLLGVSLSSAMHSLIAVDENGSPLTRCILWSDNRSASIAEKLKGTPEGKEIYRHTGTPIHPMSPLVKTAWLRENERDIFQKARKFIGIKELLVFRLCGELLIDYSIASATGLFDAVKLDWFQPALDFAEIAADKLSHPVSPAFILPEIKPSLLRRLKISSVIPFVIGASDGCLANLGAGALDASEAVLTIGTSGAVRLTTDKPFYDPQERIFNYLLTEKMYVTGGASNNGAVAHEWFTRQFFGLSPLSKGMKRHLQFVSKVTAGSDGLLFLPYLLGERAPVWNAGAKGVYFGINGSHTKAHFHRAVLEGILLNLCLIGQGLEEISGPYDRILAGGGFTGMDFWVQMAADVFGKEVRTLKTEESSAFGAALLGMKTLGYLDDFSEVKNRIATENVFQPNSVNHRIYQKSLALFREIYQRLDGAFVK